MFVAIASLVLLSSALSPQLAQDYTTRSTSPTTVRDVNVSDSITRFKNAREEAAKKRQEVLEQFRARKQEAVDKAAASRAEFQEKVTQLRDENKQRVLTNLAERFSNVNSKWTTHWNNVLSRLSEILAKIDSRSDDPIVQSAVSSAEAAIATAQRAVNEQAGKVYDIEINDEATLGQDVRELISQFHGDLREVQALVKDAREGVAAAFRVLKNVGGEVEDEE